MTNKIQNSGFCHSARFIGGGGYAESLFVGYIQADGFKPSEQMKFIMPKRSARLAGDLQAAIEWLKAESHCETCDCG